MTELDLLDHVIRNDIKVENGYSYNQIVDYVSLLKKHYKYLYQKNIINQEKVEILTNTVEAKLKEIDNKEKLLELKNSEIQNLKKRLLKKMTFKERLLGKIKL